MVAEATEKRVAAPTPRRADSEGIVMISGTNDRIDITIETRGGRVRLYKTTREQTEEGVGEREIQQGDSKVYQSAPDTIGIKAALCSAGTLSGRPLASLQHPASRIALLRSPHTEWGSVPKLCGQSPQPLLQVRNCPHPFQHRFNYKSLVFSSIPCPLRARNGRAGRRDLS